METAYYWTSVEARHKASLQNVGSCNRCFRWMRWTGRHPTSHSTLSQRWSITNSSATGVANKQTGNKYSTWALTYQELILHNISKSIVDNDILIFLNHKFERSLPTAWPGDKEIKRLVQKAAGLFIWAETAYRFVYGDRRFMLPIAKQRLHLILQDDRLVTKPEDELGKIYMTVLKNFANHDYDEEEKKKAYEMLRKTLGSIVLLFSPLSADSLASLINFFRRGPQTNARSSTFYSRSSRRASLPNPPPPPFISWLLSWL